MEAHLQKTIDDLLEKLRRLEKEESDTKRLINEVCKLGGADPMFAITEDTSTASLTTIKADTFYGQPFATAAAAYLRMRKAKDLGPATVNDIHEALRAGGYQFEAKNDDYAKRGIRHSLSKNTQTFHRLPNGSFGMLEWYPDVKRKPSKPMIVTTEFDDGEDNDEHDEEEEPVAAENNVKPARGVATSNGKSKPVTIVTLTPKSPPTKAG